MLKLAKVFQNGMVLQREKELCIWGRGTAGKTVEIMIQEVSVKTRIDDDGKWNAIIPPLKKSYDEVLVIKSADEKIVLSDIQIGEVWIAAGQSNMEFWMRYEIHYQKELLDCENPDIRFYDVPKISFEGQEEHFDHSKVGIWRRASRDDLEYFTAVGYYFAKEICAEEQVPVGIIGCNWGGTASMAWMSESSLRKAGAVWLKNYEEQTKDMDMEAYWKRQTENPINDTGNPFSNAFNECALPKTITLKERDALAV